MGGASCHLLTKSFTTHTLHCIWGCWGTSQAGCAASAGGQGFADVAVTCLARAAAPHGQQTEEAQGPPLSPNLTWQELQGQSTSAGSSPEKARAGLFGAAFGAAANALKAIGNPGKSRLLTIYMRDMLCLGLCFLDRHNNSPGAESLHHVSKTGTRSK